MKILKDFESFLRYSENLSENTVKSYVTDVKQFLDFIGEEFSDKDRITDFIYHLSYKGMNPSSIRRKISSIDKFYEFLIIKGLIRENPISDLLRPKMWERLPKYLTIEEVNRLIDSASLDNEEGIRDRAIMELIYSCGLRASEVVNLRIEDIDFERKVVTVREGKGGKDRIVPITDSALNYIKLYLSKRRKDSPFVFTSKKAPKLTRQRLWQVIKKYAKKAGIDLRRISPHVLRHSFATHLLLGGIDLRILQELLGHSSIRTTEVYTHLANPELERLFRIYHPRGKLKES